MKSVLEGLLIAEKAALTGAKRMIEMARNVESIRTEWKADNSMVLSLDLASQEAIGTILTGQRVMSEEDPPSHQLYKEKGFFYLVDPLDGTHSCRRMLKNHKKFVPGQIGFGPMIGLVQDRKLVAATFFSLTEQKLFSAIRDKGAYEWDWVFGKNPPAFTERKRLWIAMPAPLRESAVLYYPGKLGEMDLVKTLRERDIVENVYRFGGFANDCTRLARGFEQLHVQLSLKAWDLPAALIAIEAGHAAIMDPNGKRIPFADWEVADVNPLLMAHAKVIDEVVKKVYGDTRRQ